MYMISRAPLQEAFEPPEIGQESSGLLHWQVRTNTVSAPVNCMLRDPFMLKEQLGLSQVPCLAGPGVFHHGVPPRSCLPDLESFGPSVMHVSTKDYLSQSQGWPHRLLEIREDEEVHLSPGCGEGRMSHTAGPTKSM